MKEEFTVLCEAVRHAGERAMQLAADGFETHIKKDRSPVTSADFEVNRIVQDLVGHRFSDDGWLSEETPDDPARLTRRRVWIIDPIDGTKAFIKRIPQFCISVGLVQDGRPVLGVIYNPATEELFTAVRGEGARLNDKPVRARPVSTQRPRIFVSATELQQGKLAHLLPEAECEPMNSIAYALALVAAGRADATVTYEKENEWDLAAGTLIVEESGGVVFDGAGNALFFNRPTPVFQGLLAAGPGAQKLVGRLFQPGHSTSTISGQSG